MKNGTLLAAIDMGSNSFRLEIGRFDHGQIHRTEYVKETVRLGGGLDEDKVLSDEAMQRGWDCLARFAERLAGFPRSRVRAVATPTLREAINQQAFVAPAEKVLGFPIEVIPGREEARLIYGGVSRLLPQSDEKRLVIDIGGRSTELILGQGYSPSYTESFHIGSVNWTQRFFPDGQFSLKAFEDADLAAKALLSEITELYPTSEWHTAYGSSGTVGAVAEALVEAGQSTGAITPAGLVWLRDKLIRAGSASAIRMPGVREDRKAIIGGGLAVLSALLDLLRIEALYPAQGALRQGVLYDLLDREHDDTDMRTATVKRLVNQFAADPAQAQRVCRVALQLFRSAVGTQTDSADFEDAQRELERAAQLHEIGAGISHSGHHKHGAYILHNADAAGFAVPELHRLSQLVLGQRGKLHKPELIPTFEDAGLTQALASLRLAIILCHARRDPKSDGIHLRCRAKPSHRRFVLSYPKAWADSHPQSVHLLQEETHAWERTPWQLVLEEVAD